MKKLLIALMLLIVVAACNSTKKLVKNNYHENTAVTVETTQNSQTQSDSKIITSLEQKIVENDSVVVNETIVELSKPDSTGVQHAERITTRIITSGKNKQLETVSNTQQQAQVTTSETNNATAVQNQTVTSQTDVKTVVKKPVWIKAALLLAFIAIGIFLVLKFGHLIWK